MVLAGHRPEIIMDIATRAIMFWNYQQHQEHLHQEMVSKHLRDMINQFKNDSEVETKLLKSEIQTLRGKIEGILNYILCIIILEMAFTFIFFRFREGIR